MRRLAFLLVLLALAAYPVAQQSPTSSSSRVIPVPVPIAQGGTGQATQTAAFNALDPLTTQGDLLYHNGTDSVRLAAGTSGQYLKTLGVANPAWSSIPAFTGQLGCGDSGGYNMVASGTNYCGTLYGVDNGTADGLTGYFVPRAATLVAVYGRVTVAGTLSSAQLSTLVVRKNGTTDILTVTSTLSTASAANDFNVTGASVAVNAGDNLYFKMTDGAWTTSPTVTFTSAVLSFEVP